MKFPRIIKYISTKSAYLWFIFLSTPTAGVLLEYFCFIDAFERSGSLLVCVAVICVYLNHFISNDEENLKTIVQAVNKMGSTEQEIEKIINPEIKGNARISLVASLRATSKTAGETMPQLNDAKDKLVTIEFFAGVSGTLIWGFGGLVKF